MKIKRNKKTNLVSFFSVLVFLLSFTFSASSQDYTIDFKNQQGIEIEKCDFEKMQMQIRYNGLRSMDVTTKNSGTFTEIFIPGTHSVGEIGTPKLPATKKLIAIPFGAEIDIKVSNYTVTEYDLSNYGIQNKIMPVQPSINKSDDPDKIKFEYDPKSYQENAFIKPEIASSEILGTLRGIRLARITVAPVQYNPVQGKIKVFNDIELEINFINANKTETYNKMASTYSPYFEPIYESIMNYRDLYDDHPDLTTYPVKYVILADRSFETALQPFIEWKTKKGFTVIESYTDVVGTTTTAIQTYLHGLYNSGTPSDPAPSFVLLVGDVAQIPASATGSSSGKKTDLYYATVDGDYFPEMYYGRFSAENLADLQPQIDKTLYYEQYQFSDPAYLDRVTLIAGSDATWNPNVGQPTVQYGTTYYFNAANGYSQVNDYLSSYTGCYNTVNTGVGFINYTAHCSQGSWGSPSLSISDVNAFTNQDMYPMAVGNCCLSADFGYSSECIGEAWVRAQDKGAVVYLGSSPSTYWFEDFYWAVGAFPISGNNGGYVPDTTETTLGVYDGPFKTDYVSAGAYNFLGNIAVTEVDLQGYPQHSSPTYYWQAYNVLGDPSIVMYHTQGEDNIVNHLPTVPLGVSSYSVEALPGSYVAISKDGVLHGAALVDGTGQVDVDIVPITTGGSVDIVITKPQYKPYMTQLPAASLSGAYVTADSMSIVDPGGNSNNLADYGETVSLDVTLKNVGSDVSAGVEASITTTDNYISIIQNQNTWGNIPAGGQVTVNDAFEIEIADFIPDQHVAVIDIEITDDNDSAWNGVLRVTLNAPVFEIDEMTITNDDDGNGRLDPGETAELNISVTNTGHATANLPIAFLEGNSPYFTISNPSIYLSPFDPSIQTDITFYVAANSVTTEGTLVDLDFTIQDMDTTEKAFELVIGQLPQITIGTGSANAEYYPFYTYYENNKSQMLYLASEIGPGSSLIKEIGYDITTPGSQNMLTNLSIKFKHTPLSQLGASYEDMSSATTVFSSASYTLPSSAGWHNFDITDFTYNGTDNLLVEVVWGDNGTWLSPGYSVSATSTPSTSVVYGYSDSETPPAYDANSNNRPNLFMQFEGAAVGDSYPIEFIVVSDTISMTPIANAKVMVGSLVKTVDGNGITEFELLDGSYIYSAFANQHDSVQNISFSVAGDSLSLVVLLNSNISIDDNELSNVQIYPNPAKDELYIRNAAKSELFIYNIYGELLMRNYNSKELFRVNTKDFPTGNYIIKILNDHEIITRKFIVNH